MTDGEWRIDPGLAERFRAAAAQIQWREPDGPPPGKAKSKSKAKAPPSRQVRIAHLNDEEARVEADETKASSTWVVDSGPVGALVLLLEVQRRGPPARLSTRDANPSGPFPMGAIEACWERSGPAGPYELPAGDLILLARYALV
jgi:hypothetical protein